jgi:hypothetical protein
VSIQFAADTEPEHITQHPDSQNGFTSLLQENNGAAKVSKPIIIKILHLRVLQRLSLKAESN